VLRHIARLVTRLVAPLVVDYSASRGLVVDYSASRGLVVDYFAFVAWLVTRLVVPLVIDYSASRRLVVDYFAFAARLGASARRATCHAARRAARRRLLRLAQARRRLLRLRRVSGCLGTSRGLSRGSSCRSSSTTPGSSSTTPGSSSTTSPPSRAWVPRHVARLVTRLIAPLIVDYSGLFVNYFAYTAQPAASARRAARRVARRVARRAVSSSTTPAPRLRLAATLALLQPLRAWWLLFSRQHWLYFEYTMRRHDVVFRSHRVDHSS
jgi:hypothetical protein